MREAVGIDKVSKSFFGNKVLHDVSLSIKYGEIHSICGENGAGKSTLMKIIGGIYNSDGGTITVNGEEASLRTPQEAYLRGIGIVHQELSLADNMPVWHNIFVNREITGPLGFIKRRDMQQRASEILEKLDMRVDPRAKVSTLPFATKQMIEIGKLLSMDVDVLILDEPTSALSERESQALFDLLLSLKKQGKAIIFISHKLDEVRQISDRVTVLRDGRLVGTLTREEAITDRIVSMMVGRDIDEFYPPKAKRRDGKIMLKCSGLSRKDKFEDISFDVREGEILGLYGLVGSGRTEVALSLVGADKIDSGTVELDGMSFRARSPRQAVKSGLCYLSEDRKQLGLFLEMTLEENFVSSSLERVTGQFGVIQEKQVKSISEQLMEQLGVVPKRSEALAASLSGGNQQKVLLGKWLSANPRVLIVDEPSRGVDIGAKSNIHFLLRELADRGMAILMISSDLPEILGLSDRVMVMHEGRLKGILENTDLTQEGIMNVAYGEVGTP